VPSGPAYLLPVAEMDGQVAVTTDGAKLRKCLGSERLLLKCQPTWFLNTWRGFECVFRLMDCLLLVVFFAVRRRCRLLGDAAELARLGGLVPGLLLRGSVELLIAPACVEPRIAMWLEGLQTCLNAVASAGIS
jgi:hypothetical protein